MLLSYILLQNNPKLGYNIFMDKVAEKFLRSPSEGVAEGGGLGGGIPPRPSVPPSEARRSGQVSFLGFVD